MHSNLALCSLINRPLILHAPRLRSKCSLSLLRIREVIFIYVDLGSYVSYQIFDFVSVADTLELFIIL